MTSAAQDIAVSTGFISYRDCTCTPLLLFKSCTSGNQGCGRSAAKTPALCRTVSLSIALNANLQTSRAMHPCHHRHRLGFWLDRGHSLHTANGDMTTRVSCAGTLLTARLALRYKLACNTAGGTHHAFPDCGSGFCIINDMAITARVLLREGLVERVLILDLDVHQVSCKAAKALTLSWHFHRG